MPLSLRMRYAMQLSFNRTSATWPFTSVMRPVDPVSLLNNAENHSKWFGKPCLMQKYIWQYINERYSMFLSWSEEEIDSEHTTIIVLIYLGIYFRLT